jgi:hypothetical protein
MTFFFNGSQANVAISGGVATTPYGTGSNQTLVRYLAVGNGAVQNAYTVTAGCKLHVFTFGVYGASKVAQLYKTDGTTSVCICLNTATITNQFLANTIPIWTYAAGEIVKVFGTDASTNVMFWGVEVPV